MSLAVTTRTGIAQVTFPQGTQSNLLFKVGGSINPVSADQVRIVGDDEVEGQVTSGQFCGTGNNYTVHFVAQFEHPFTAHGTWTAAGVDAGEGDCTGTSCGAYVSFDTDSPDAASRTVTMKVALSFVSTPDAAANLEAEDPGWSLTHVADQATARWNQVLGRIDAAGGTPAEEHTFYTALYHSLLFPNVVSDDNGDYDGDGSHTEKVDPGHQRRVRRLLRVGHLPERGAADQPVESRRPPATWCSRWSTTPTRTAGCPSGPSSAGTSRR